MRISRSLILTLCISCSNFSISQENLGMRLDDFVPVQGMRLNPSTIADQRPWLSFQFFNASVFARNNFAYIENSKAQWSNVDTEASFKLKNQKFRGYLDVEIEGPSLSFTHRQHAFGIHSAVRSYTSIKNVPKELGRVISDNEFEEIEEGIYQVKKFNAQELTWGEIGFTYAYIFKQKGNNIWTSGITINKLIGIHAAGIKIDKGQLEVIDGQDHGEFSSLDGNYIWSEPAVRAGRGWSTSLGLTFKKMDKETENHVPHSPKGNCIISDYIYKVGISLLDFGSIKFDRASESATLAQQLSTEDLENIVNNELGDAIILNKTTEFKSYTPSAIFIHADYRIANKIYVNGSLLKGLGFLTKYGPSRADLIGASVRYSSQWLGIGVPITIQDFRNLQIGLALRVGPVIIGTDHISPFLVRSDIYASDIYASLHIPILNNPSCAEKGKQRKQRNKSKSAFPPCPKW